MPKCRPPAAPAGRTLFSSGLGGMSTVDSRVRVRLGGTGGAFRELWRGFGERVRKSVATRARAADPVFTHLGQRGLVVGGALPQIEPRRMALHAIVVRIGLVEMDRLLRLFQCDVPVVSHVLVHVSQRHRAWSGSFRTCRSRRGTRSSSRHRTTRCARDATPGSGC